MNPEKPISQRKLEANRRNAQKSTGPRTPQGKARSAKNATTHGLFATDNVIPAMGESNDEYLNFKNTLLAAFPSDNAIHRLHIEDFINCQWRMRRLRQIEAGYLDSMCEDLRETAARAAQRNKPQTPDYTNPPNSRAGDFRLIGNAASLAAPTLDTLSRYESRLRSAAWRALDRIEGKIEPTRPLPPAPDSGHTSPPEANAPGKNEATTPSLTELLSGLSTSILLIVALFAAVPNALAVLQPPPASIPVRRMEPIRQRDWTQFVSGHFAQAFPLAGPKVEKTAENKTFRSWTLNCTEGPRRNGFDRTRHSRQCLHGPGRSEPVRVRGQEGLLPRLRKREISGLLVRSRGTCRHHQGGNRWV